MEELKRVRDRCIGHVVSAIEDGNLDPSPSIIGRIGRDSAGSPPVNGGRKAVGFRCLTY